MVNKKCLITILLLQDYPQGYIHSFFYRPLLGLNLSLKYCWISSQTCIYHRLGKIFKSMVFKLLKNVFAIREVASSHSYLCHFPGKILPQVLIITPSTEKLLIFQWQYFFKNLFPPPGRKGEGGGRKLCHTQYEILKTTGKIVHLSTVQTKCFRSMQISAHPIKQC